MPTEEFLSHVRKGIASGKLYLSAKLDAPGKHSGAIQLSFTQFSKEFGPELLSKGFKLTSSAAGKNIEEVLGISYFNHPGKGIGAFKAPNGAGFTRLSGDVVTDLERILMELKKNGFSSTKLKNSQWDYNYLLAPPT